MISQKHTHTRGADCNGHSGTPASPQWPWHQKALLQLRSRMLQDRDEQTSEASAKLEAHPAAPAETATDEFDHDMCFALLANEEEMLHEVDAALSRIDHGTYGVCEESGRRIPQARLRAIPWTRYTREVAEKLERQNQQYRPHLAPLKSARGRAPGGLPLIESHDEVTPQEEPDISPSNDRRDAGPKGVSQEDTLTFEERVSSPTE